MTADITRTTCYKHIFFVIQPYSPYFSPIMNCS